MSMRRTRQERELEQGQQKDQVFLTLIETQAPYEERQRALRELEKQWMREAGSDAERQRIQRGIAEDLVTLAYSFHRPWLDFARPLRRLQRLGFSNLTLRIHIACLYVQSLHLFPRQAREAWALLEEAERAAKRLRRDHPLREEHLEAIVHARQVARVPRPTPRRPALTAPLARRSPRTAPR